MTVEIMLKIILYVLLWVVPGLQSETAVILGESPERRPVFMPKYIGAHYV